MDMQHQLYAVFHLLLYLWSISPCVVSPFLDNEKHSRASHSLILLWLWYSPHNNSSVLVPIMFKIQFVKKTRVARIASSGTSTAQHVDIEAIKAKLDKRLGRDITISRYRHHQEELPRVQLGKVESKLHLDVETSTSVKEAHVMSSKLSKRFKLPSLICGTKHIKRHANMIDSSCDAQDLASSSNFSSSRETNSSKSSDYWHVNLPISDDLSGLTRTHRLQLGCNTPSSVSIHQQFILGSDTFIIVESPSIMVVAMIHKIFFCFSSIDGQCMLFLFINKLRLHMTTWSSPNIFHS